MKPIGQVTCWECKGKHRVFYFDVASIQYCRACGGQGYLWVYPMEKEQVDG